LIGNAMTVSLSVGLNVINIVGLAQDGIGTTTYSLNVTRAAFVVPSGSFEV
jgi:hypothetical protein